MKHARWALGWTAALLQLSSAAPGETQTAHGAFRITVAELVRYAPATDRPCLRTKLLLSSGVNPSGLCVLAGTPENLYLVASRVRRPPWYAPPSYQGGDSGSRAASGAGTPHGTGRVILIASYYVVLLVWLGAGLPWLIWRSQAFPAARTQGDPGSEVVHRGSSRVRRRGEVMKAGGAVRPDLHEVAPRRPDEITASQVRPRVAE